MMKFINTWYPVIIAFICMLYSIGLGISGNTEGAQYSGEDNPLFYKQNVDMLYGDAKQTVEQLIVLFQQKVK